MRYFRHAKVTIDVEQPGLVSTRWFDIWASAGAIGAKCSRAGYAGTSNLPSGLNITVEGSLGLTLEGETAFS